MTTDIDDSCVFIPSAGKERGWTNYQNQKRQFLDTPRPTSTELLELHRIVNPLVTVADLPEAFQNHLIYAFVVLDRPDYQEIQETADHYKTRIPKNLSLVERHLAEMNLLFDLAKRNISHLRPQQEITGTIRSLGFRSINDKLGEEVFDSHTCVYGMDEHGEPKAIYTGLSQNLRRVFNQFCRTYDQLMKEAGNDLEQVLRAEAFFQTLGTRPIHPGFDGNGRTFTAHLALTLERMGFSITDYSMAQRFVPGLSSVTDLLVERLLTDAGLELLGPQETMRLDTDLVRRKDYMNRLQGILETAIEHNIDPHGPYSGFVETATWQIRRQLILDGFVEANDEDRTLLELEKQLPKLEGIAGAQVLGLVDAAQNDQFLTDGKISIYAQTGVRIPRKSPSNP